MNFENRSFEIDEVLSIIEASGVEVGGGDLMVKNHDTFNRIYSTQTGLLTFKKSYWELRDDESGRSHRCFYKEYCDESGHVYSFINRDGERTKKFAEQFCEDGFVVTENEIKKKMFENSINKASINKIEKVDNFESILNKDTCQDDKTSDRHEKNNDEILKNIR